MTYPMQFRDIPRCGAYARTTGKPCQGPAMANGRCRMHGGTSTGRPRFSGLYTKEAKKQRKEVKDLIKALRDLLT